MDTVLRVGEGVTRPSEREHKDDTAHIGTTPGVDTSSVYTENKNSHLPCQATNQSPNPRAAIPSRHVRNGSEMLCIGQYRTQPRTVQNAGGIVLSRRHAKATLKCGKNSRRKHKTQRRSSWLSNSTEPQDLELREPTTASAQAQAQAHMIGAQRANDTNN